MKYGDLAHLHDTWAVLITGLLAMTRHDSSYAAQPWFERNMWMTIFERHDQKLSEYSVQNSYNTSTLKPEALMSPSIFLYPKKSSNLFVPAFSFQSPSRPSFISAYQIWSTDQMSTSNWRLFHTGLIYVEPDPRPTWPFLEVYDPMYCIVSPSINLSFVLERSTCCQCRR